MLKGFPVRTRAVFLTAAVVLLLLAAHLLTTRPVPTSWRNSLSTAPGHTDPESQTHGDETAPAAPLSPVIVEEPVVKEPVVIEPVVDEPLSEEPTLETMPDVPPCFNLPGSDDITVIMRTGATEIHDKLPAHFNTTFRCYKDLVLFSDFEETFMDHPVHDVLRSVDPGLKESNRDFELYLRLQNHGREGLHADELSGKASFEGGKSGKNDNAGWRLDKWKFLPMMVEILRLRPHQKFYVFLETDSYVVWSNLLKWLENVDPAKPMYAGSEVQIGPDVFAHGGSVFVMTNAAVRKGAAIYEEDQQGWNAWTGGHWAGDCVLGKALHDAGVDLTWAWPMFQGGQPVKMDFTESKGRDKLLWCAPALSYHHFSPLELKAFWDYEQAYIQNQLDEPKDPGWGLLSDYSDVLHHRDVFREFVLPNITEDTPSWNNLSPTRLPDTEEHTFEQCRKLCEDDGECLQFNYQQDGCWISSREVMLGQPWGDIRSGWMLDRIEAWMRKLDLGCRGREGWTVS